MFAGPIHQDSDSFATLEGPPRGAPLLDSGSRARPWPDAIQLPWVGKIHICKCRAKYTNVAPKQAFSELFDFAICFSPSLISGGQSDIRQVNDLQLPSFVVGFSSGKSLGLSGSGPFRLNAVTIIAH